MRKGNSSIDVAAARAAALACWREPVTPEPLGGGLSNTNFVVRHAGRRYVVRIGDDVPEHAVWRFNEVAVARAAHTAGLSPAVHHHETGALVLDYVEGARTCTAADVRDAAALSRIVDLVRRCHRGMPKALTVPGPMFWVFAANRRYARLLADSRLAARLPARMRVNDRLEQAVGPILPVFCHNDLLAANLLDDGRRLWLIDWEYGGWNDALFDLAYMAGNNAFDEAGEALLLECYYGQAPSAETWLRFAAMKAASLLREALWSLAAECFSALEIDYAAYTDENFVRFEQALRRFEVLAARRA
jgi:thiamine kinase-like enzyme